MVKKYISESFVLKNEKKIKKTSQGRDNVSRAMMNKSKRRSFKIYRGQGRA